jgi:hypothetical protein
MSGLPESGHDWAIYEYTRKSRERVVPRARRDKVHTRQTKPPPFKLMFSRSSIRHRAERRYGELLVDLKATGQIVDGRPKCPSENILNPLNRL